tara:strand:+ start:2053 stop:2304 length:252 start_codon:yes stop_codon:yes gene_type:complete
MSNKFKAVVGLSYPDATSRKLIPKGGVSKLSLEEQSKIKYKNVAAGKTVDDLPESAIKWLLKDGLIVEADGTTLTTKKKGARR